jgi:hypothetical protein
MEKNQVASRVNNAGAGVWCRFVLAVTPRPAGSFCGLPGHVPQDALDGGSSEARLDADQGSKSEADQPIDKYGKT